MAVDDEFGTILYGRSLSTVFPIVAMTICTSESTVVPLVRLKEITVESLRTSEE
jgi:predicted porin